MFYDTCIYILLSMYITAKCAKILIWFVSYSRMVNNYLVGCRVVVMSMAMVAVGGGLYTCPRNVHRPERCETPAKY